MRTARPSRPHLTGPGPACDPMRIPGARRGSPVSGGSGGADDVAMDPERQYPTPGFATNGGCGTVDHREAAARLYREYGPAVYRRCLRLLRDRDAAQDATQEVFVKLVSNMGRLEGRGEVLPWIYRVATNHCLNLGRNTRR